MNTKKMKAVTFSYDDAVTQDQRLIELFDRYGLKCTFNLNSGLLGKAGMLIRENVTVAHVKPRPEEIRAIYAGHEIAAHTLTHPSLKELDDAEIVRQVEEDRLALSELAGYEVVGMAYPGGTQYIDDRTIELVREKTGIRYARTTTSTHSFEPQTDLIRFDPTVYHHVEFDKLFELANEFLTLKPDTPKLFYIWGHAYEFDIHNTWAKMEKFCQLISGQDDIFYGTNREVLLGEDWI
ncbi:MAG: polysaccharide deacetylase family protein [Clostridia bacterium]|nr:polysaccharide deacetylase family protein [Clostridia bacterium]